MHACADMILYSSSSFARPPPPRTEYLNLYDNRFTGTIPSNLRLRDLVYLDLGRNVLYGSIPSDIGDSFVSLRQFHIDFNRLSGSIPESKSIELEKLLACHEMQSLHTHTQFDLSTVVSICFCFFVVQPSHPWPMADSILFWPITTF
jgi:hypothetical protein